MLFTEESWRTIDGSPSSVSTSPLGPILANSLFVKLSFIPLLLLDLVFVILCIDSSEFWVVVLGGIKICGKSEERESGESDRVLL